MNRKDEVLLLRHVLRPEPGWGLPGGFINRGEQAEDGIRREILEETGVELLDLKMIRVRTIDTHIETMFSARADREPEIRTREIFDLGWFTHERLPEGLPRPQRSVIEQVLKGRI